MQAKRKRLFIALGATVLAGGHRLGRVCRRARGAFFVSTDNAYTAAEVAQITPAVEGTVAAVRVKDTQAREARPGVVELDQLDAKLAVAQAEAELERALRRVRGYVATDANLGAQIAAREADATPPRSGRGPGRLRTGPHRPRERRPAVGLGLGRRADPRRTPMPAPTRAAHGESACRPGRRHRLGREAERQPDRRQRDRGQSGSRAAHRALDQARVDLGRTVLRAPMDGVIARRQVQLGQRVQRGMPLMAVVPVARDVCRRQFQGSPVGESAGRPAGRRFTPTCTARTWSTTAPSRASPAVPARPSPIPAQNATGNWIKVVQRLPVRVKLDPRNWTAPLKVGLSMNVRIDTRGKRADLRVDRAEPSSANEQEPA